MTREEIRRAALCFVEKYHDEHGAVPPLTTVAKAIGVALPGIQLALKDEVLNEDADVVEFIEHKVMTREAWGE